jgi:hypothetical protein
MIGEPPSMNFAIRYLTSYQYDGDVVDNLNALRVKPAPPPAHHRRARAGEHQAGDRSAAGHLGRA